MKNRSLTLTATLCLAASLLWCGVQVQAQVKFQARTAGIGTESVAVHKTAQGHGVGNRAVTSVSGPVRKDPGKVYITLEALFDYGDGSGYQLLLDKDHTAGDNIPDDEYALNSEEFVDDADFSVYEYKIPENATGSFKDGTWLLPGNSVTIEIEPGIYDYFVTNPTPADGYVWIIDSKDARGNDFEFKAGDDYIFRIMEDPDWEDYISCVRIARENKDITVSGLASPLSGITLGEEPVSVRVRNNGKQSVTAFSMYYSVDGGGIVEEDFTLSEDEALLTNEERTFTFSQKYDFSTKAKYTVTVRATLEGDAHPEDNQIKEIIWHYNPIVPPYLCTFDNQDEFERWKPYDSDHSGDCWKFRSDYSSDESDTSGCTMIFASEMGVNQPEFLLHVIPFRLMADSQYYISYFFVAGALQGGNLITDHLQVLYGLEPDPASMKVLADRPELYADDWTRDVINFMPELDTLYYFALAAWKEDVAWTIYLDNFEVGVGKFAGEPDLTLTQVLKPVSSCELGADARLGVIIRNLGYADVDNLVLNAVVNGGEPVSEAFMRTVKARGFDTVYFTPGFDFTDTGRYEITISIEAKMAEGEMPETVLDNNSITASLIHFSPAPLPFITDFIEEADRENWTMEIEDAWQIYDNPYDPYADHLFWSNAQGPLYSRCVEMEADKQYRFRMSYAAGIYIAQFHQIVEEPFAVLCGLSGSDMNTWDTVAYIKKFTNDFVVNEAYVYKAKASGPHTFAIVPMDIYPLRFKDITITEVFDYDLRMAEFDALPRYLPEEHANSTFKVGFEIENTGSQSVGKANLIVYQEDIFDEIGGKEFNAGSPGSRVSPKVEVTPVDLKEGDEVTFRAVLGIGGLNEEQIEDGNAFDNIANQTLTVTDEVLAYESLTEADCLNQDLGVGPGEGNSMFGGALMYFPVRDTLTAVSVMWAESEQANTTGLTILPVNLETGAIGEPIYEDYTLRQNLEPGEQLYEISARMVEPGYYFVFVKVWGYSLVCELDPFSVFYMSEGGKIYSQAGMGIPGIRAHFGHGAVVNPGEANEPVAARDTRVRLYPNPVNGSNGTICVRAEEGVVIESVEVFNLSGKTVASLRPTSGASVCTLNTRGLRSGVYFARVNTNVGISVVKFVVR